MTRHRDPDDPGDKSPTLIVLIVVACIIFRLCYVYATPFNRTITIAERPALEGKLIKSTGGDWYRVGDEWLLLVFRSRDTWGNLTVGKTYVVKGYGWRVGPFSMYPNITNIVQEGKP